jgi:UDP-N-acetylmuramoyl-tripeptide--D-alanyl-D-alanine ligase
MEARSLQYIAKACGGELCYGSPSALGGRVCADSRAAATGDVFFALAGERFDGHAFVEEVAGKGVAVVVAQRGRLPEGFLRCPVIVVEDTRKALGRLAARYRRDFVLPVVVVGGSNGKTTTKELLGAVLRQAGPALWNEGSFNNEIGVPMSLLRLEKGHWAAVAEAGTNHPGELKPLLEMIAPKFGIITNIGREHLEFFGDLAGVAAEEGTIGEALPGDGVLFLNGDDVWADALAKRTAARVVRVGVGSGNDWRASEVSMGDSGVGFRVSSPGGRYDGEYRVRLMGRHQVGNALLALAVAAELGMDAALIRRGLLECAPAKMRLQLWNFGGVRVLEDCYNANADSMAAALGALKEMPCEGRRIAALGDMGELGAQSVKAHEDVGFRAAELPVDCLVTVGEKAAGIAAAARSRGLAGVVETRDAEDAARVICAEARPGDVVLIKASRSMRLERITQVLRGCDWREV